MLTATYSIVALKLEQKKVRWNFSTLQSYILCSIKNLKNAGGIELGLVVRHVGVNMVQRPAQAFGLQGDDFVAAG